MREPQEQFENIRSFASQEEREAYLKITNLLQNSPIPSDELIANLGLYLDRSALGHIIFLEQLYRRIMGVHGVIFEFGVRWGRNLALFESFRNLHEPRNCSRRIVGFDTFEGFPDVRTQDGTAEGVIRGAYSVTHGYETILEGLLAAHERFGFRSQIRKFELVKGDVADTLPAYLARHPETILALAYFDLDLYEPTKRCLELIKDRLVKGSVIVFDELAMQELPGETIALLEAWGLNTLRLQRTPMAQFESFVVIE